MSPETLARGGASSTPLIDPRLRDRRIEVARDHGRRRLRRFLVVLVLVASVVAAVAATRSPLLDVDRIAVRGVEGAPADEVRAASGVAVGDPLVDVDPGAVAERVEAVPWVADATVVRRWPGGIEVRVDVRTPVAVVGADEAAVVVDGDGRAIAAASARPDGDALPAIDGSPPAIGEPVTGDAAAAAAVVAALPDDLRAEVAEVRGPATDLELELRDGIVVAWGDGGQQSAKAEALGVLLAQDDRDTFARIDVSVPRASTVTFRGAAEE